jgi:hypothetical protein
MTTILFLQFALHTSIIGEGCLSFGAALPFFTLRIFTPKPAAPIAALAEPIEQRCQEPRAQQQQWPFAVA